MFLYNLLTCLSWSYFLCLDNFFLLKSDYVGLMFNQIDNDYQDGYT